MRTISVSLVAAVVLVVALPVLCTAQYHAYSQYPWYPIPVSPQALYPPPAPKPPGSTWFRLAPDPEVYRRWGRYTAELEYQRFQRSPNNPESDLDFMLRTFW